MAVLKFTIEPEAISKLHDVLVCLGRFQESVCLEATRDKVRAEDAREVRAID